MTHRRAPRRALVLPTVALTVAGSLMGSVAPASAATTQYCAGEATSAGSSASVRCFATFGESITYATKGRVHLANATQARPIAGAELGQASNDPAMPDTNYVLSIDYKDANFSGSTFTWYQTSPCGNYQAGSMPSGWNDVISSVAAYSGCATTLYWDSGFGQPNYAIGVDGSAANLGTFNDKASSQKWCATYPCG